MSQPPPLRFSHYRVLQHADGTPWRLGAGAMGEAYKAYDERLRIEVALKLIHPMRVHDAKVQSLFLREARAAARVRHPNVASVLFLNDEPENLFYAMEFVAGKSLQDTLRERGQLPLRTALSIGAQIAHGLDAIHAEGIVHRDLKPANLMLFPAKSRVRGEVLPDWRAWQARIIDFGLARAFEGEALGDDPAAQTRGFRGTVRYASPEQCEERGDLDGRSDQYSLGCILWEMLLGSTPFHGKSQHELMNQHVSKAPPLQLLNDLPDSVQAVIARLLIKDRGGRYATAAAAAKALERCLERINNGTEAAEPDPPFPPLIVPVTAPPAGSAPAAVGTVAPAPKPPPDGVRSAEPLALTTTTPSLPGWRGRRFELAAVALVLAIGGVWGWEQMRLKPATRPPAATAPGIHSAANVPILEKSIAVLPFENLSEENKSDVFTNGVQDEILTDLAKVSDLKVISRSSVMQYKSGEPRNLREIGRALGITYVLEGSVKRSGDRVRVTAQLVDTRTNTQLWAERFEPEAQDIFSLQAVIAGIIVRQLKAKLTPEEKAAIDQRPTSDLRAYELYLYAKDLVFTGAGGRGAEGARAMREALGLLTEAVARDPAFFHAHCLLAYCHDNLFWFGTDPTPERLALAQASIDQAARLRPAAGELHQARALHFYWGSRDYPQAAAEIALANRLLPNDRGAFSLRGYIDRRQGRFDDAIRSLEKAAELSPREVLPSYDLAESYAAARRGADFFRVMDHLAELSPRDQRIRVYRAYGGHLMLLGDPKPLQELLLQYQRDNPATYAEYAPHAFTLALYLRYPEGAEEAATALASEWTLWSSRRLPRAYFDGVKAFYFGRREAAREAFLAARAKVEQRLAQTPEDDKALMTLAFIEAYLGRKDDAKQAARRAMDLLPLAKDAVTGANHLGSWAEILAICGESEQALQELKNLPDIPFAADYGDLIHSPVWDALRADARFQAVLKRMAPTESKK